MAIIMDGKSLALSSEEELKMRVTTLLEKKNFVPILATILVGSDPASKTYVKMKRNACERIGMKSIKVELDSDTTTEELLSELLTVNTIHSLIITSLEFETKPTVPLFKPWFIPIGTTNLLLINSTSA